MEHTAFRLETRDRYDSPSETAALAQFMAGEPVGMAWLESWLSLIRGAAAAGQRFFRVRVVSIPLTDYSRFGVFTARYTDTAGEDIRYLARNRARQERLPDYDYWLLDSRTVVRMHFGEADRFQGGEIIEDPATVVRHNYWRDAAWHWAVRRDDFAAEQHL